MSDDLPTPERLRRIEQGVSRRIDLRRLVARRVAGGSVAVLLVAGGFALLPHLGLSSAGGSAASSGSAAGGSSSSLVTVRCDGPRASTVRAERAGLPASAIAACASRARTTAALPSARSEAERTSPPSPAASLAGVLCRADDGGLHVRLGAGAGCAAVGMQPFAG